MNEIYKKAEEHRYMHEYGDMTIIARQPNKARSKDNGRSKDDVRSKDNVRLQDNVMSKDSNQIRKDAPRTIDSEMSTNIDR